MYGCLRGFFSCVCREMGTSAEPKKEGCESSARRHCFGPLERSSTRDGCPGTSADAPPYADQPALLCLRFSLDASVFCQHRCKFHIATATAGDAANLTSLQDLVHLVSETGVSFRERGFASKQARPRPPPYFPTYAGCFTTFIILLCCLLFLDSVFNVTFG